VLRSSEPGRLHVLTHSLFCRRCYEVFQKKSGSFFFTFLLFFRNICRNSNIFVGILGIFKRDCLFRGFPLSRAFAFLFFLFFFLAALLGNAADAVILVTIASLWQYGCCQPVGLSFEMSDNDKKAASLPDKKQPGKESNGSSSSFQLSPEQQQICATVVVPTQQGAIVRVTSAAGTGKTTTLLELAKCAFQAGHTQITYLTFNKSAAEDAQRRIQQALQGNRVLLEASTIHSCAMRLLRRENGMEDSSNFCDDDKIKQIIENKCREEIASFLRPCYQAIRRSRSRGNNHDAKQENAKKQVIFFLHKTLVNFCRSKMTLDEFQDKSTWNRTYYPGKTFHFQQSIEVSIVCSHASLEIADDFVLFCFVAKVYHGRTGSGKGCGFLPEYYEGKLSFYADLVSTKLWEYFELDKVVSYDLEVKRAQLRNLQINGTLLLVDECQDMDECQIRWISKQSENGTQVFLVGDCAQTIYGFRGAKSKSLMDLSKQYSIQDCTLTNSWRFGPNIARVANCVLYCKEKSSQTSKKTTWNPYRVTGASKVPCQVTKDSIMSNWKEKRVTVIASTNAMLLMQAVAVLGFAPKSDEDEDKDDASVEDEGDVTHHDAGPLEIPKIHLNGKGPNSGARKWRGAINEIEQLYHLFSGPIALPAKNFPDFDGRLIDWNTFVTTCKNRELTRYSMSISVVQKFGKSTMEAVNLFEEQVLKSKYSADEADVILTTTHAAKGMEWDNVQISDDFIELCKVKCDGPNVVTRNIPRGTRSTWQIECKEYGDDVNILYVACTRAKKLLAIPSSLVRLYEECDLLHGWIQAKKLPRQPQPRSTSEVDKSAGIIMKQPRSTSEADKSAGIIMKVPPKRQPEPRSTSEVDTSAGIIIFGLEKPLSYVEATHLYEDVVVPLREENHICADELLLDVILSGHAMMSVTQEPTNSSEAKPKGSKRSSSASAKNSFHGTSTLQQEIIEIDMEPSSRKSRRVSQSSEEVIEIDQDTPLTPSRTNHIVPEVICILSP
jgi:superfamily I DNA/RNA helicase